MAAPRGAGHLIPTLPAIVRKHAAVRSSSAAFVCEGKTWSWSDTYERSCRLARALGAQGVAPGDRVAWIGQNCHRFFEALFATNLLGAIFVPFNWRSSSS